MVYAEVVQSVLETGQPEGAPQKYRVTFRVKQVVAQPVNQPPFTLGAKSFCTVWITVGPGGLLPYIASGPSHFAKGTKYYLHLKYRKDEARYEQAEDSGLLQAVAYDDPAYIRFVEDVRKVARYPDERRAALCQRMIGDAKISEPLRIQALSEAVFLGDPSLGPSLQRIWQGPIMTLDDAFAVTLDLQTRRAVGEAFVRSEERREFWLRRFLSPMDKANDAEAQFRNNALLPVIVELGQVHPDRVGPLLLAGIKDAQWSDPFRVCLLRGFLNVYRTVETLPAPWTPDLQNAVKKLQDEFTGQDEAFLEKVLSWAASPPHDPEIRAFK